MSRQWTFAAVGGAINSAESDGDLETEESGSETSYSAEEVDEFNSHMDDLFTRAGAQDGEEPSNRKRASTKIVNHMLNKLATGFDDDQFDKTVRPEVGDIRVKYHQ